MRLTICLLFLASAALSQTTYQIASPFNSQNRGSIGYPFLSLNTQAPSIRYQQVYASSDFLGGGGGFVLPGPHLITEISFTSGFLDVTVNNVRIDLSTTQKQPD